MHVYPSIHIGYWISYPYTNPIPILNTPVQRNHGFLSGISTLDIGYPYTYWILDIIFIHYPHGYNIGYNPYIYTIIHVVVRYLRISFFGPRLSLEVRQLRWRSAEALTTQLRAQPAAARAQPPRHLAPRPHGATGPGKAMRSGENAGKRRILLGKAGKIGRFAGR